MEGSPRFAPGLPIRTVLICAWLSIRHAQSSTGHGGVTAVTPGTLCCRPQNRACIESQRADCQAVIDAWVPKPAGASQLALEAHVTTAVVPSAPNPAIGAAGRTRNGRIPPPFPSSAVNEVAISSQLSVTPRASSCVGARSFA
jgi:hypothetical protein